MNRRIAGTALFLAVAAVFVLISGCTRPMSSGPIPKPQSAQSIVETPTPEGGIPTDVVATTVAGATATVASSTEQPTVAPIVATPAPTIAPAATSVPGGSTSYTVKPGDRLFSIGRQFGVNPYAIAQTNHIGPPYTLHPGQVLTIPGGGTGGPTPPPGTGTTYTVQSGDTIYSIGRKLGKSPVAIINANNLINPNRIFPGMVLNIP
jgi:LysM repeat protein